jgi:hypothetical protein
MHPATTIPTICSTTPGTLPPIDDARFHWNSPRQSWRELLARPWHHRSPLGVVLTQTRACGDMSPGPRPCLVSYEPW